MLLLNSQQKMQDKLKLQPSTFKTLLKLIFRLTRERI